MHADPDYMRIRRLVGMASSLTALGQNMDSVSEIRFCHGEDEIKTMISLHLKVVAQEYPLR